MLVLHIQKTLIISAKNVLITHMHAMVKCSDCKNLVKVYVDSVFARFGEKKICKVKNIAFNEYYEVEKERECEDYGA